MDSNRLMSLSAVDNQGNPWIATVYFTQDENLCLYFLSHPTSRHCKDIAENEKVACAIANSNQVPNDKKTGIQLRGNAEKLSGERDTGNVIELWNSKFVGFELNYEQMMNEWESRFYKIAPSYIKWFNEELYGEEGVKEWEL